MRLAAVLLASALCLSAQDLLSDRRAPGFSLPDLRFRQHDLEDHRGQVVLLELMQTTCPFCQKVILAMDQAVAKYPGKVYSFAIVNPPDNTATVSQYIATFRIKTTILFDCGQAAASYLRATPQNPEAHFPHLFLIDPQGVVRAHFGPSDLTDEFVQAGGLSSAIARLVNPPPAKK